MMARLGFRKTCDSETSGLIKSAKEKKSSADLRIFYLIVIQFSIAMQDLNFFTHVQVFDEMGLFMVMIYDDVINI